MRMVSFARVTLPAALIGLLLVAGRGVVVPAADAAPAKKPKAPTFKKAEMSDDPTELYLEGATLAATGKLDACEALARKALEDHPASHGFHLLLGDVHSKRGKHADAYYEWQWEFLRAGPVSNTGELASTRIASLLGAKRGIEVDEVRLVLDAVMLTQKDPKAAYAKLQKIERDRGRRFALRSFMAEALHKQGEAEKAIALYRELLSEDEYFVPGYVQLAALLKKQGKEEEAREKLAKARLIDPDNWRLPRK